MTRSGALSDGSEEEEETGGDGDEEEEEADERERGRGRGRGRMTLSARMQLSPSCSIFGLFRGLPGPRTDLGLFASVFASIKVPDEALESDEMAKEEGIEEESEMV